MQFASSPCLNPFVPVYVNERLSPSTQDKAIWVNSQNAWPGFKNMCRRAGPPRERGGKSDKKADMAFKYLCFHGMDEQKYLFVDNLKNCSQVNRQRQQWLHWQVGGAFGKMITILEKGGVPEIHKQPTFGQKGEAPGEPW